MNTVYSPWTSILRLDTHPGHYGMFWSLEAIGHLFDQLAPLCTPDFTLTCDADQVRVAGVPEERRDEIARIVLDTTETRLVPFRKGRGYSHQFSHRFHPSQLQRLFTDDAQRHMKVMGMHS